MQFRRFISKSPDCSTRSSRSPGYSKDKESGVEENDERGEGRRGAFLAIEEDHFEELERDRFTKRNVSLQNTSHTYV